MTPISTWLVVRASLVARMAWLSGWCASLRARDLPLLAARLAQALLAAVRRLVAPAGCAACDARIDEAAAFCAACASAVVRVRATPAKGRADAASAAPKCSAPEDDIFAGAAFVAYGAYGGALAKAVCRFKYGERPDLAEALGGLLREVAREAEIGGEVVVPVPLHPRKLRERGYNQAALLASAVAREIGAKLAARALQRTSDTRPQASLDRDARHANVAGAIRVRDVAAVRARRVVLVDDVATTGATLRACREALLSAGAARVTLVVLARADHRA
jgi:ComF family protein